jgi:D-glycero-D-manno-heptose 1,7-bisphosphate phosphatase
MNKALFLDRDGIIVECVYDDGHIRTITSFEEIQYVPGVFDLAKTAVEKGYKIIIISNQPGVGLLQLSKDKFYNIDKKIREDFQKIDITITAAYYCFHHPYAKLEEYKKECNCRKPKPGMLLQAAKEHDIDLKESWFVGDGVNDVKAGYSAGTKTILLGNLIETEYLRMVEKNLNGIKPNFIVKKLKEIINILD